MEKYFNTLKDRLNKEIEKVSSSNQNDFDKNEQCKMILVKYYKKLQSFAEKYNFKSEQEEIRYFKHLKPQILSEFLYYNKVTKMINFSQIQCLEISEKHLNYELKKVSDFYETHIDFISYINSGQTFSDEALFLRKNVKLSAIPSYLLLREDISHITNGGHLVVKLLLNRKIQNFILQEKSKQKQCLMGKIGQVQPAVLSWTNSKSDLIELIYSLHSFGAINNGNADIKEIVNEFERFFNINLGDPYRHFTNIKQRKKSPTSFLEQLTRNMNWLIENKQLKSGK